MSCVTCGEAHPAGTDCHPPTLGETLKHILAVDRPHPAASGPFTHTYSLHDSTIEVPLSDLRQVMDDAASHLAYFGEQSPAFDRIQDLIDELDRR